MSLRYQQSGQAEEAGFLQTGGQIADDDDGGWSGIQRTFAGIALAVSLAASAFAAQAAQRIAQDPEELPVYPLATGGQQDGNDEPWWGGAQDCFAFVRRAADAQATALATDLAQGVQQDPEEIPAAKLLKFSTPDEDLWQNPLPYSLFPVPCTIYQRLPYLPELNDDPAGSFRTVVEEDYWQNPIRPVPPTLYQALPSLPDATDDPVGSLHGQPDEDFWASGVAPVAPAVYQTLPIAAGEPAEFVTQVEEECWENPVEKSRSRGVEQPNFSALQLLNSSTPLDEVVPQITVTLDEDFWENPVEKLRSRGVEKPNFSTAQLLNSSTPLDEIVPQVSFTPDEDFWANAAQTTCRMWQVACRANPAYDLTATTYQPWPCLPELSDDPVASLAKFATPDEDFWTNGVASVPLRISQPLPIAGAEPAEIPTVVLPPNEDSWSNPVAPTVGRSEAPPRLYLPDLGDDAAGSLRGLPDEDYWTPRMPQVAWAIVPTYTQLPAAYRLWSDQADLPLVFCAEDDAWGNPAQAVCRMLQVACGVNPTYALPPAIYQPLAVWETEPFTSYWWMTRWAVRTHSMARARKSHSLARVRESHSAARARVSREASRQC